MPDLVDVAQIAGEFETRGKALRAAELLPSTQGRSVLQKNSKALQQQFEGGTACFTIQIASVWRGLRASGDEGIRAVVGNEVVDSSPGNRLGALVKPQRGQILCGDAEGAVDRKREECEARPRKVILSVAKKHVAGEQDAPLIRIRRHDVPLPADLAEVSDDGRFGREAQVAQVMLLATADRPRTRN